MKDWANNQTECSKMLFTDVFSYLIESPGIRHVYYEHD